ncbi:MAG: hypothetical protein QOF92_4447 [Pseudonocardiales bacterium]|jgi:hypothetical protein|nr:hypothetical protein [Pseudonocardiales bacterium]
MDDSTTPWRPQPGPRHASPDRPPGGTSRRWFLAGGAAVVLAAGGGVGADFLLTKRPSDQPPPAPPDALLAAAETERALIADLDATTGGAPAVRQVISQARANHAAHLSALRGLLADYRTPSPTPSTSPTPPVRGTPRTAAQLRAAEQRAAATAAQRASALDGTMAALFASIAACEATHAALLA